MLLKRALFLQGDDTWRCSILISVRSLLEPPVSKSEKNGRPQTEQCWQPSASFSFCLCLLTLWISRCISIAKFFLNLVRFFMATHSGYPAPFVPYRRTIATYQ